ncbi:MaoC family dehydratase [Pseudohalocynthiibacter aestuariivivens]|nr:MaoC family dehydratase [Pseudohalocynthiibacter aestuariivivens]QIE46068.1 MaoC family dehydratase [Pseudohalocynthiibacter aestuariivivens]
MTDTETFSRWFKVEQSRIDAFADVTEDWQFIHTDPVQAAQTPFGGTVAHGFLSLSLLSAMYCDALPLPADVTRSVNYGFDKLRFLSPVHAGAQVRGAFRLLRSDDTIPGQVSNTWSVRVEIEGGEKPALIARWLTRYYTENSA